MGTQHHYLPAEDPYPPRRIQRTSTWDNSHGDHHTMGEFEIAMGILQVDLMMTRIPRLYIAIKCVISPLNVFGPTGSPANTMQSQAPSTVSVRFRSTIMRYL